MRRSPKPKRPPRPWVSSVQPEGVNILDPDCPVAPAELLTVLPLGIRVVDGRVFFKLQARDSLIRILKWFKTVILAGPRIPEERSRGCRYQFLRLGPGRRARAIVSSSCRCLPTVG